MVRDREAGPTTCIEAGLRCFPLPPSPYSVLLTVTYSDVHTDVLSRAIQHLHFLVNVVGQR